VIPVFSNRNTDELANLVLTTPKTLPSKVMMRLILIAFLLGLLTACGTTRMELSSQLVQRALALQLSQTQQQLSQQLQLSVPPMFEINQLAIAQQQTFVLQDLPTYRVRGTYDLTIQLPTRQVTQNNPFEVYLQRQKEGKTWRLAVPQSTSKETGTLWLTYLIQ